LGSNPLEAETLALDHPDWGEPDCIPQFEASGWRECHDADCYDKPSGRSASG
jgi:hypothetical protein